MQRFTMVLVAVALVLLNLPPMARAKPPPRFKFAFSDTPIYLEELSDFCGFDVFATQ